VDQKRSVARLLEKANKYRDFARWVGDRENGPEDLTKEIRDDI
jgi:hypothetical protein